MGPGHTHVHHPYVIAHPAPLFGSESPCLALVPFLNPVRPPLPVTLLYRDVEDGAMACSESVLGVVASAVDEIDRCLGWRNAGAAISGAGAPSFKHISTHEDPARFTIRVMIAPMVSELGYGDIRGPFPDKPVEACGSVVVSVGMNRPLDEELLIDAMRLKGCEKGIVTDGFRWTLAVRNRSGLCLTRVDLRPYYVGVLEERRFRCRVDVDRRDVVRFARTFSRRAGRKLNPESPLLRSCSPTSWWTTWWAASSRTSRQR